MAARPRSLTPTLKSGDPELAVTFDKALLALGPFETSPRLAAAVSGGPDSLCLTLLARDWCHRHRGHLIALTVDHGLREESRAEADQVHTWLTAEGIEHHILTWQGKKPATRIQAAARQARYQLLIDWCIAHDVLHLLLGHQADDQAETIIFRSHRHSGPDGLAGMAAVRDLPWIRMLRPLLSVRRETLRQDLIKRGQDFLEDPSNIDLRFTRARLRQDIDEKARREALDLAIDYAQQRQQAEDETALFLAQATTLHPHGFALLDPRILSSLNDHGLSMVLRRVALCIGAEDYPPRTESLDRLREWIRHNLMHHKNSQRTLAGCCWIFRPNKILVCREYIAAPTFDLDPKSYALGETSKDNTDWLVWDRRFSINAMFYVNLADGPAKIDVLGRYTHSQFLQNLPLQKLVLPSAVKKALPIIVDNQGILAIPHFGYLRPERAGYGRRMLYPARIIQETVRFTPHHPLAPAHFCSLEQN